MAACCSACITQNECKDLVDLQFQMFLIPDIWDKTACTKEGVFILGWWGSGGGDKLLYYRIFMSPYVISGWVSLA